MNRARGTNVFWRKPAVLITSCVVMVAVSVGVAAGVVGPGLVMQAGETDHVACAGSWLSVTNRDKTSLDLRCATGRDRNTDPTPNRSSTDPTPNTSSTDTTTTAGTDAQGQMIQNHPGYQGAVGQTMSNIQSNLQGNVAPDVAANLATQAAQYGVGSGMAMGKDMEAPV